MSFKSPPHDPEKAAYQGSQTTDRPLTIMALDPSAFIPSEDKLLIFRTLTGIDTVPAIARSGHAVRTAANIGIYTRVVRSERAAKKAYRIISTLIHACLALQIIIGAGITAIGAAAGSHRAITGLGACNTIFAGALAYVKGSGYPETLKHAEMQWRRIREYVEQRERELCLVDCGLDVYREVRAVEDMYQRTKEELKVKGKEGQEVTKEDRAVKLGQKRPVSEATMPAAEKV